MVNSNFLTGSSATQTQCGERDSRVMASASLTSPACTALSSAKSSSSWTCVTRTACKKYWEKVAAWSATSTNQCNTVFGSTSNTRATARMPKPSASAHCPHQLLGRHALAMQRRAVGLLEIAPAARAIQLAPRATAGMPIGTDIAQPHPALIRTVRMRAEVPRGVHLARPSPRGHEAGWRSCGGVRVRGGGVLTGGTEGPAGEARKRLRVAGVLARWQDGLGWLVW